MLCGRLTGKIIHAKRLTGKVIHAKRLTGEVIHVKRLTGDVIHAKRLTIISCLANFYDHFKQVPTSLTEISKAFNS